ncbi:helix-turn-helix domain-containing protein [Kluyvera sp. STS39-E]|uniref:helix-turn-helix domain-containing protein n=1 Tax=Kluyvera sp. STS39-E TaxID=3234748 RepID=UPI0034C61E21
MPANVNGRRALPNYALYGAEAAQSTVDIVHHERIPSRASRFGFDIEPHFHDALIQLLYITHGGGETSIDGQVWRFSAPCLLVIPARSVHGFRFRHDVDGHVVTTAQSAIESVAMTAAPDLLTVVRTPAVLPIAPPEHSTSSLTALFDAIGREAEHPERWQYTAGLALTIALLVQVARLSEKVQRAENPARAATVARVERFRTLLDDRCRTRQPVASYAAAMGISAGQLTRLCREAFGISAIEAIDRRAIHEAKRLLGYSSYSIKQIARELGFRDEAYFGRFFRKQTGLRPTEYRLQEQGRLVLSR